MEKTTERLQMMAEISEANRQHVEDWKAQEMALKTWIVEYAYIDNGGCRHEWMDADPLSKLADFEIRVQAATIGDALALAESDLCIQAKKNEWKRWKIISIGIWDEEIW